MALKPVLKEWLQRTTGLRVLRQPPFGADKFADLTLVFPSHRVRTVVDVGANVGQSAITFLKAWPQATVHCCEPVPNTLELLRTALKGLDAQCHGVAIGARRERLSIHMRADGRGSDISSLHGGHPSLAGQALRTEEVQVITLAELFAEHGIVRADHLKIDTEGHDLAVIEGAEALFTKDRIGVVDVEVGMNPTNTFHVPLARMTERMAALGHQLFGLYDQMHEWPTRQPVLRRCNALYIPASMAKPGSWSPFPVE